MQLPKHGDCCSLCGDCMHCHWGDRCSRDDFGRDHNEMWYAEHRGGKSMSKLLTKDDILQVQDLPTERVYCPEWSGEVIVRGLTGAERDKFEASIVVRKGDKTEFNPENMRAKLVALCVVDEQGNRIFSDDDVKLLGKKSAAALDRVFQVAQRLSGLNPGAVEELAKN